jgi:hypothetical protein
MSRTHERAYRLLAERVRLDAAARWSLYAIVTLLVASGGGWIAIHYSDVVLPGRIDEFARLASEALALKLHGVAAFATLLAFGAMLATHALRGWALRHNRVSGSAIVSILTVLTVSGYALYYLVDDHTRPPISLLHWVLGLAFVPALVAHIALGRRSRRTAPRVPAR